MENSGSSENNNPEPEHIQKQETHHFIRSRGRPNRLYGDLRELLNQKRQNHNDSQGNGPPPEPSHNFLSDPLRDNEPDCQNKGDRRADNFGSGRFAPRQHNTVTFENRNRGGGRGRGRGNSYRKYEQPRYHGDNRRDDEWREERHRVDQERIQRQRSDSGGWKREWDAGKEDMWKGQSSSGSNKPQYSPQNRPANSPHPDRRNKPPIVRQEGDQPVQEQGSPNQLENNPQNNDGTSSSHPRAPRKFNPDKGGNQNRPPQKYNPNYNNSNRGARNFHKQTKPPRPNPINITVEFSAETGQRTCTIEKCKQTEKSKQVDKSKKVQRSRSKKSNSGKKGTVNVAPVVDCEENWDNDDIKNHEEQNNDTATEGTSDKHEREIEDTNLEQFDDETGDNEDEEYDEADDRIEEQYDDAHIEIKEQLDKVNDIDNKTDDDIKIEKEMKDVKTNVDDSKTDIKQEIDELEAKNQSENKECDKQQDIVASTEEIAKKREDRMQNKEDSTNEIKNCDTQCTSAIKEECNKEKLENGKNAEVKPEKIEDNEKETK